MLQSEWRPTTAHYIYSRRSSDAITAGTYRLHTELECRASYYPPRQREFMAMATVNLKVPRDTLSQLPRQSVSESNTQQAQETHG